MRMVIGTSSEALCSHMWHASSVTSRFGSIVISGS
jgi:hypothetical protein